MVCNPAMIGPSSSLALGRMTTCTQQTILSRYSLMAFSRHVTRKAQRMLSSPANLFRVVLLSLMCTGVLAPVSIGAASCRTQSQMTAAEREALSSAARSAVGEVQAGDVNALRSNTVPAVAADFGGIANSVADLKPLVQQATITVNSLYMLDATNEPAGATRTDFYCGTPVVVMNFMGLPPGMYALAIVQTSGVAKPQQISLILSESADHRWMLGGLFSRPMMDAGHDGL